MQNFSMLTRATVLAVCVLGFAACGGDDDEDTGDNCSGKQLTESAICQLQCGQTTTAQAQTILGQPSQSASNLLQYSYTCVGSTAGSSSNLTWSFYFADGVFSDSEVVGIGSYAGATIPSCIASCTP